jgi:hypothetical protein
LIDPQFLVQRQHPTLKTKFDLYKLISDSYAGGKTYLDGNHLWKFSSRESTNGYDERKKRAIHINNVQPLADMLAGFLFMEAPQRKDNIQQYLIDNATGTGKNLDSFMYQIATQSLMYTTCILVESPQFDTSLIQTEADRIEFGANPYCVRYEPWKVRDFYPDIGQLDWILLDNSYTDKSDPFVKDKDITQYRLWTREYYQDFVKQSEIMDSYWKVMDPVEHNLGEVPVVFVNWRTKDNGRIADSIFEDIAYFDKALFNSMSLMDEMISAGTFKFLFYPSATGETPDELRNGFTSNAVIPFDGSNGQPFFSGAEMNEISPFLSVMEFHITCIKRLVGLDTDANKDFEQSGIAKAFDFKKTMALLISGAREMENTEKEIFRFAGLWEGKAIESDIKYFSDFLREDIDKKLVRYFDMINLPYEVLKKESAKLIVKQNLTKEIDEKTLKEIITDIESTEAPEPVDTQQLIDLERQAVKDKDQSQIVTGQENKKELNNDRQDNGK